ncbi:MAG: hypothetical protein JW867_05305 [Candidatus Omnitrophica bacterium]|nr:hypothetical protein [Candidatus Omnitrophota bacterium]
MFRKNRILILLFFYFLSFNLLILAQEQEKEKAVSGYPFDSNNRDPLSPLIDKSGAILIHKEVDLEGLNLKGIIYSNTAPLAIINDEVLSEGQEVGGYIILEISEKEVKLQKGNEGFTLKLEEEWEKFSK